MAVLTWDETAARQYETGVDRGVFFGMTSGGTYAAGVAWNGLTSYTESPSGGEANPIYADNIKYADLRGAEDFGASIECYTYPEAFEACLGNTVVVPGVTLGQQKRSSFGFSCRTKVGNDVDGDDFGYKLHIIWNAMANPSDKQFQTIQENPDATTFSFELETTPVTVTGYKPTAHMTIDSTKVDATKLGLLEAALYGTATATSYLPTPDQVIAMLR